MRMTTALTCAEVSTVSSVKGELGAGPWGFEAVACMKRSELVPSEGSDKTGAKRPDHSGEPTGSRKGMGIQLTGGCTDDL